ncbi:MAG: hypothetical protein OEM50_01505 [Gammaproteobacteria bacterium]|nr:hypothetical protein [Gammaproteobacteria bacterium]MDH3362213.1 hypothetical protein [Gammaproteobacteria bacterium]MDH3480362.1 hypothetical protein [Gammaproteobacteria bacterium]
MRDDVKKIGIIGAGVGGLITAKTFLEETFARVWDFLVVCNGLYSTPHIPSFPKQDQFEGRIVHFSHFQDPEHTKGAHAVVVGFGKSAFDRAEEIAAPADQRIMQAADLLSSCKNIYGSRAGNAAVLWKKV